MSKPLLFLIDGTYQIYRAYHAFRGQGLSNQEGQATHAVYGFVTMLRKLVRDKKPTHIAASFDLEGPTFRDEIVDDYKANREDMPDDLVEQIEWVYEACEAMGVPIVTAKGYEADDVIGTVAMQATKSGFDVAIVSVDKDFFQLVRKGVRLYDPRDGGAWFDEAGVAKKFGVPPAQVIDVLALVGDASDNVAGVPGIGKKGAVQLMSKYGSLDVLLEKAETLPQKRYRESLLANKDLALQSRDLVTIRTDVPITPTLESFLHQGPSRERCYDLFSRLGFRTMVNDYAPTEDPVQTDYSLVQNIEELDQLIDQLRAAGKFALHVVTDVPSAMRAHLIGVACSISNRQAHYIPLTPEIKPGSEDLLAPQPNKLDQGIALARFKPLLEDSAVQKVGHDLKFDTVVLERHGIHLAGISFDSMLASYLLDARAKHSLEDISLECLGYKALTEEDVRGSGARAIPFNQLTPDAVLRFVSERADLALQLAHHLAPRLVTEGLDSLYREMELPLIPVLAAIECAGVPLDSQALMTQSKHLHKKLEKYTGRIYELAGCEFNVNSPKQLADILFNRLKLPSLKKTGKTRSASTSVEVLEELSLSHELPRLILEWRGLHKLKSTYVDALPLLVHPDTRRIHTCFNQAVATTGRLSSSEPNLQNIPIRTELGRQIRRAFVADSKKVLISADYSQIELRVLAHLSNDETLIEAFRSGEDIHNRTAMQIFGPDSELEAHELRRRAKIVNYALLYGKTAFTLAKDINVSTQTAQAFIEAYFSGFPRVRTYINATLEEARQTGIVQTMFGRRRLVPDLNSHNGQIRAAAERVTVNMPIQGTAADILKRAMIDLSVALPAKGLHGRMILTVHDELLLECTTKEAEATKEIVREKMEAAAELAVPLTVDVGVSKNWCDAKP